MFPNAELKFFLTADPEIRAQRRFRELQQKGRNDSLDAVRENLSKRDYIDTHREDSPLTQALDAHLLDNSHYTPEEQLSLALEMVQDRVGVGF